MDTWAAVVVASEQTEETWAALICLRPRLMNAEGGQDSSCQEMSYDSDGIE